MIPLFFVSMQVPDLGRCGWFGGDPGVPVIIDGKETFPLVPVAVGLYSTSFNIFNTALLFPSSACSSACCRRSATQLAGRHRGLLAAALPRPRRAQGPRRGRSATSRTRPAATSQAAGLFLAIARGEPDAPDDVEEHYAAIDVLSRDIRAYTAAHARTRTCRYAQADLVASLIEEEDLTASLGETLYQIARRIERQPLRRKGRELVDTALDKVAEAMRPDRARSARTGLGGRQADAAQCRELLALRERCLHLGAELPWAERGAILALLGSAERAFFLIERIDAERRRSPRGQGRDAWQERPRESFGSRGCRAGVNEVYPPRDDGAALEGRPFALDGLGSGYLLAEAARWVETCRKRPSVAPAPDATWWWRGRSSADALSPPPPATLTACRDRSQRPGATSSQRLS